MLHVGPPVSDRPGHERRVAGAGCAGGDSYAGRVTVVFVLVTVVVVVAIGLVAVGRATAQLAEAPPRVVFDLEHAVVFVGDEVPFEVSAVLSYDDVRDLLGWYLDYLEAKGVAAEAEDLARADQAGEPLDAPVGEEAPVVADDDEEVAWVLGRADEAGLEVDDVAVHEVIAAANAYLEAIGAVGGAVSVPGEPPPS